MARGCLIAIVTALAVALWAPLGADARTPCAAEEATPTGGNSAQVSDAIFCLSNEIRASFGLPAFQRDASLDASALQHSADMSSRRFFAHTNPDGQTPSDRAAAHRYTSSVGENIAVAYPNARSVVLGWMASAGHCRNILSGAVHVGIGTDASAGPNYTQDFGDYFSRAVDETARSACPHSVNLDALPTPPTRVVAAPAPTAPPPPPPPPPPSSLARATLHASVPALSALSLSSTRLRAGRRGATISYRLSAPATVTFRFQRAIGRRARYRTLPGRFTHRGTIGANTLRFTGRLATKPGRYRLQAVATDAAGNASPLRRAGFELLRR